MAIVRLALSNPSANTDTLIHTAERQSLVSVLATNKSSSAGTLTIWVAPQGTTTESQYAYISYNVLLPVNNSLETFRFSLENGDRLYVRSSIPNVSFSLNAIHESSGNQNIVTISASQPAGPSIGDVWVNQNTSVVSFWSGSAWVSAVGGSAGYAQTSEPAYPNAGAIWVDTDADSPTYPQYPTVIYSPTQPTGLGALDAGTIWVDEDSATLYETVVPAIFYASASPTGLNLNDAGYLWVNPNENIIEYNMNEYIKEVDILNSLMLAGM
jgi:hypothetical protein